MRNPILFSILVIIVILFSGSIINIQPADALKSSGTPSASFGSKTDVCGDHVAKNCTMEEKIAMYLQDQKQQEQQENTSTLIEEIANEITILQNRIDELVLKLQELQGSTTILQQSMKNQFIGDEDICIDDIGREYVCAEGPPKSKQYSNERTFGATGDNPEEDEETLLGGLQTTTPQLSQEIDPFPIKNDIDVQEFLKNAQQETIQFFENHPLAQSIKNDPIILESHPHSEDGLGFQLGEQDDSNQQVSLSFCSGLLVTISGTDGNDTLEGTEGPDVIDGMGGHDVIYGLGGDDVICGGEGHDEIHGGDGDDKISGGDGHDAIWGDAGDDEILGGNGEDVISGGDGRDLLRGEYNDDVLNGDDGNDYLYGGPGNDHLYGGQGNDLLSGHWDDDMIWGGSGADILYGNYGNDSLSGDSGSDQINGDFGDDLLIGGIGNDVLFGGADNDRIFGGTGYDVIWGGSGDDYLDDVDPSTSITIGGPGSDTCVVGPYSFQCER